MALIQCPECSGQISDRAILCPHCGSPMKDGSISTKEPRKARKRRPNGSGTVVKLSGKRKSPFQVRVNTRIDTDGYPAYDVIGCYPDRVSAGIALAEYNKAPMTRMTGRSCSAKYSLPGTNGNTKFPSPLLERRPALRTA